MDNALCVPAQAVILACGIDCPDIGKAYRRNLSSKNESTNEEETDDSMCGGFIHQSIADFWQYDKHGISIPLWEYNDVVRVTDIVEIGKLDYEHDAIKEGNWQQNVRSDSTNKNKDGVIKTPFTKENATCHAIAFWVDYRIRIRKASSNTSNDENDDNAVDENFETVSTGISCQGDKQMVRILPDPIRTGLDKFLTIQRYGLEL